MTNTFTIGQKVTGGLALLAMETHKIKNTDGNFTFWYENNKLMGHALPDVGIGERERSITYFQRNTFEVVGTIEPPFKKGDLVRITSNHADALTIKDEIVEVINYDESKTFPIKVKKDDGRAAVIRENFAVKLTADEIKEYKDEKHCKAVNALEVGSFVRIHADSNFGNEFKTGDIVVVVFQEPHESTCPIKVAPLHNPAKSMSEWATYKEVEIVTEEEAIKAKISLVKTGGKQHYNIRKATDEEVKKAKKEVAAKKERKIFEDLGRNYGELKEGDVVRVIDNCGGTLEVGDIGEVIDQSVKGTDYNAEVKVAGRPQIANWAIVKLIVPVEHRLDK